MNLASFIKYLLHESIASNFLFFSLIGFIGIYLTYNNKVCIFKVYYLMSFDTCIYL